MMLLVILAKHRDFHTINYPIFNKDNKQNKILSVSENRGFRCKSFEILDPWKRNKAIERK